MKSAFPSRFKAANCPIIEWVLCLFYGLDGF